MCGLKNIEIKIFRGIDHLSIDGFARVNVLVGQNNSGKSTVLEALMMLMGMSNSEMPKTINAMRVRKPFGSFLVKDANGNYENIFNKESNRN